MDTFAEIADERRLLADLLSGLNVDRANERLTRQQARRPFADIVDVLRRKASRFTPPGAGPEAPLTDVPIHGLDIRRPLGLTRERVDFDH